MRSVAAATAVLLCACNSGEDPIVNGQHLEDGAPAAYAPGELEVEEIEIVGDDLLEASLTSTSPGVETISVSQVLRNVRRRGWQLSPRERRDRVWDLDNLPQEEAEATALLRIWTSEVEMSNERDMFGIWQVTQNVRARHCDNTRFSSRVTRRITQCRTTSGALIEPGDDETIEGAEETYLSAMRRLSERALGVVPARSARGRWIREVTLSCERPESWNRSRRWEQVMQPRCEQYAPLARALIEGTETRRLSRVVLIAWGGRCERHCDDPSDPSTCRQTGACDDAIACRRGLARIESDTSNAFWCRPGNRGCPSTVDPICEVFGVRVRETEVDPPTEESSDDTDLTTGVSSS